MAISVGKGDLRRCKVRETMPRGDDCASSSKCALQPVEEWAESSLIGDENLLPAHYQKALERLGVMFSCGPILLPAGEGFPLSLPEIGGHTWHWKTRFDDTPWGNIGWKDIDAASKTPQAFDGAVAIATEAWLCLTPAGPDEPTGQAE